MGNQQGKLGIDAIVRLFSGQPPDPSPATDTVEFSPITADTAAWFTTVFHAAVDANGVAAMVGRPAGESASPTDENFERLFLSVCSSGLLSCTRTPWPRLRGGVN